MLELGPGFTAITGETGAGKTMVVTALGLLLGGRADAGPVRTGARPARVEGRRSARRTPLERPPVDEVGGEVEDGRLVLARQISRRGPLARLRRRRVRARSRTLAALADPLVAVHGQSDQHRLLQPGRPARRARRLRRRRDAAAARRGSPAATPRCARTEAELAEVVSRARERAREADLLRFGLAEVEAVDPQPGEDAALAAEEARLGFADTLRAAAEQARECLSAERRRPRRARRRRRAARRLLDGVRDHDPEAAELADRLAEISYLLSDVAADVASYASGAGDRPGPARRPSPSGGPRWSR